jgi:hypothetical protein
METQRKLDEDSVERINERIRIRRRVRDAQVRDALKKLAVEAVPAQQTGGLEIAQYALRHHVLYECCRGIADRDYGRLDEAKALGRSRLDSLRTAGTAGPSGDILFLWKAQAQKRVDGMYDSDPYIVTALPPAEPVPDIFREALVRLGESRYREFFVAGPGIAVILERRERTDAHNSYTLSGLPATIYLDLSASPVRMAESILHETVHCWFNEALAAEGEQLAADMRIYSPWKGTERPIANFLHAVMAFGVLQQYFADMANSDRSDGWDRKYCTTRRGLELENLQAARDALGSRIEEIHSCDLRRVIRSVLA